MRALTQSVQPNLMFMLALLRCCGDCAPPTLSSCVCLCRLKLKSYRTVIGTPDVDLDVVGKSKVGGMDVEVIDPVEVRACARARARAVCVGSSVLIRSLSAVLSFSLRLFSFSGGWRLDSSFDTH